MRPDLIEVRGLRLLKPSQTHRHQKCATNFFFFLISKARSGRRLDLRRERPPRVSEFWTPRVAAASPDYGTRSIKGNQPPTGAVVLTFLFGWGVNPADLIGKRVRDRCDRRAAPLQPPHSLAPAAFVTIAAGRRLGLVGAVRAAASL